MDHKSQKLMPPTDPGVFARSVHPLSHAGTLACGIEGTCPSQDEFVPFLIGNNTLTPVEVTGFENGTRGRTDY